MNTITLNLENKTITLNTHEVQGQTLYKAQDLLNGYGMDTDKTNKTVYNWNVSMKNKNPDFQGVSIKGRNGGTYLTKRQILKLAAYVDYEFEDAVFEAFELLSEGKVDEALDVAITVTHTAQQAHIIELIRQRRYLGKAIANLFDKHDVPMDAWNEFYACYKMIGVVLGNAHAVEYRRQVINKLRSSLASHDTGLRMNYRKRNKFNPTHYETFTDIENKVLKLQGALRQHNTTKAAKQATDAQQKKDLLIQVVKTAANDSHTRETIIETLTDMRNAA